MSLRSIIKWNLYAKRTGNISVVDSRTTSDLETETALYIKEHLDILPQKHFHTVLDYGCGIGRFGSYLRRRFSCVTLFGYEVSFSLFNVAKKSGYYDRIFLFQFFVPCADLIFVNHVLGGIPVKERRALLKFLINKLNSGGELILIENITNKSGSSFWSPIVVDRDFSSEHYDCLLRFTRHEEEIGIFRFEKNRNS